jgi:MFS transporter, DHA1 family, multidrug resistance protein
MAIYALGVGLVMPQAMASAMMPFPERAGAASSFVGLCQMSLSAVVGLGVGFLLTGSALPLPTVIAAIGCGALLLFVLSGHLRSAKA